MANLVGADIGGTFTDFVSHDAETGTTEVWKVPSEPADPVQAIIDGLGDRAGEAIEHLRIGTTVATNAILERQGAVLAYVTTRGFRDVPFIQRGNRKFQMIDSVTESVCPSPGKENQSAFNPPPDEPTESPRNVVIIRIIDSIKETTNMRFKTFCLLIFIGYPQRFLDGAVSPSFQALPPYVATAGQKY